MAKKTTPLADIIAAEIRDKGPLPFSRYMELCLYHPDHGYYERSVEVTGRQGDFFTAPHVHALFGQILARWMMKKADEAGIDPIAVLELGPGNGLLAGDLLDSWKSLGGRNPLYLVETSAKRRKILADHPGQRGARILGPRETEALPSFDGFVIANEFFDALPARVVVRTGRNLCEVFVSIKDEQFIETLTPLVAGSLDPAAADILTSLPEGFRAEYAPEGRAWLARLAVLLRRGFVLIFDYGDIAEMLAAPWRERGTLRCFSAHHVDVNPYERPGEKDITASVNFSLIRAWAEAAGFSVDAYTTQSSFLVRAGILERMAEEQGETDDGQPHPAWAAVKMLIMGDGGMGEAFKVMVLKKD